MILCNRLVYFFAFHQLRAKSSYTNLPTYFAAAGDTKLAKKNLVLSTQQLLPLCVLIHY